MPSLKEVRLRIASVKNTRQITNAMKLVSASKFRKAQRSIISTRPYAQKLRELLANLAAASGDVPFPFSESRPEEKILLVGISSNKGLCGAFNANVIKAVKKEAEEHFGNQLASRSLQIIGVGRHVSDFFSKKGYPFAGRYDHLVTRVTFEPAASFADELMELWKKGEINHVWLVYNQFKNAATQIITIEPFLPLSGTPEKKSRNTTEYLFLPDRSEVLEDLVVQALRMQIYKALLDSFAAEQGARMTAMMKATDNASEMLKELQLQYNKARQAAITREIIEIVSGANALGGK